MRLTSVVKTSNEPMMESVVGCRDPGMPVASVEMVETRRSRCWFPPDLTQTVSCPATVTHGPHVKSGPLGLLLSTLLDFSFIIRLFYRSSISLLWNTSDLHRRDYSHFLPSPLFLSGNARAGVTPESLACGAVVQSPSE